MSDPPDSGRQCHAAPRVCLVISSFRHDDAVAALLEAVHAAPESPFERTIVVDSLGTGRIPSLIAERGWIDVEYRSYDRNLGSAGNLSERLRLAALTGADFAYAVNHDALLDPAQVPTLVQCATRWERVGAVYPLRYITARGHYDLTGSRLRPLSFRGPGHLSAQEPMPVHWSSSNGALYSLAPIRAGLGPRAELWMGWEDMGYGWTLEQHGYRQFIVPQVRVEDSFEYARVRLLRRPLYLVDKPAWYAYYHGRNLLLLARWSRNAPSLFAFAAARVLLELGVTTAFRKEKRRRCRLLLRGVHDGLRGRSGMGPVP